MSVNEYIPKGYVNMTEYNRHKAFKEKVIYWIQGICGGIVLLGAYAVNGIIDSAL